MWCTSCFCWLHPLRWSVTSPFRKQLRSNDLTVAEFQVPRWIPRLMRIWLPNSYSFRQQHSCTDLIKSCNSHSRSRPESERATLTLVHARAHNSHSTDTHQSVQQSPNCQSVQQSLKITPWIRAHNSHSTVTQAHKSERLARRAASFAEYSLFYRALLQKRPLILRSLLESVLQEVQPTCMGWLRLVGSFKL